jgi:hypothetical protein
VSAREPEPDDVDALIAGGQAEAPVPPGTVDGFHYRVIFRDAFLPETHFSTVPPDRIVERIAAAAEKKEWFRCEGGGFPAEAVLSLKDVTAITDEHGRPAQ